MSDPASDINVRGGSPARVSEPQPVTPADRGSGQHREWRCTCGQLYRISGSGRHRIYWPEGASASEPVMDGCCCGCGATLPGKQGHRL